MKDEQLAFFDEVHKFLGPPEYVNPEEVPFIELSDKERLCKVPLVSVLCITYNHATYIEKTFQGFEEQLTEFPFEIIIGEDCSSDATIELCKSFQIMHPESVRLLTWKTNVGMTANLLRCLAKCRGKYIAFCEGDDFWCCPTKLQEQVDYLEAHPQCGIVHSNAIIVSSVQKQAPLRWNTSISQGGAGLGREDMIQQMLEQRTRISSTTVVVRKSIMDIVCNRYPVLYTQKRSLGDIQLWTGVLHYADHYYFDRVFSAYALSENSATRSKDSVKRLKFICDSMEIFIQINDHFRGENEENRRRFIDMFSVGMLYPAYIAKQWELISSIASMRRVDRIENSLSSKVIFFLAKFEWPFFVLRNLLRLITLVRMPSRCLHQYLKKVNERRFGSDWRE